MSKQEPDEGRPVAAAMGFISFTLLGGIGVGRWVSGSPSLPLWISLVALAIGAWCFMDLARSETR